MSQNTNIKTGTIWLPYFKQGDDMSRSIVTKENNSIDAKASFNNHIEILKTAICKLENIKNHLPDDDEFEIYADTHFISITGDKNIIDRLASDELVTIESTDCSDND